MQRTDQSAAPEFTADLGVLVNCHSTPGDEDAVAAVLAARWRETGWNVGTHGRYAVSARLPGTGSLDGRPTLLVCAHMDSPGFVVESRCGDRMRVVPLGRPDFQAVSAEVIVKVGEDRIWTVLERDGEAPPEHPSYWMPRLAQVQPGDRLCFHGSLVRHPDGTLQGPFLDNRLGCAVLCDLARQVTVPPRTVNLVLGATASEEMGQYGARVLAEAVRPDLVVCVDATYEDGRQGVALGGGPVLTLSDASVLLGCRQRDRAIAFCQSLRLPLQTEVYNYSGTDARAFPHAGLPACVYPLLLPTEGNHTASETANLADAAALVRLLRILCADDAWRLFFDAGFALE